MLIPNGVFATTAFFPFVYDAFNLYAMTFPSDGNIAVYANLSCETFSTFVGVL